MAHINKRYWGVNTNVSPLKTSFGEYIDGAVKWAKTHKTTVCKKCGTTNHCTHAEIRGNDVVATFVCGCGHTTKYMTPESELRRTYNS